jgi:hypothetical protein
MTKFQRLIKILGIQRSGTNYLQQMLRLNFSKGVLVLGAGSLGSKHITYAFTEMLEWLEFHDDETVIRENFDKMRVIVTVRSPMSWTIGHLRHIAQNKRLKKHSVFKPGSPRDHAKLITDSLNPRYQKWKKLCEDYPSRTMFMRFEDLVCNPMTAMMTIASTLDVVTLLRPQLVDINREVFSSGQLSTKAYDRREYYRNKEYLKELKPGIKRAIIEHTDWDTARFFGYEPEE